MVTQMYTKGKTSALVVTLYRVRCSEIIVNKMKQRRNTQSRGTVFWLSGKVPTDRKTKKEAGLIQRRME